MQVQPTNARWSPRVVLVGTRCLRREQVTEPFALMSQRLSATSGPALDAAGEATPRRPSCCSSEVRRSGRSADCADAADLQMQAVLGLEAAGDARRHAYALSRLAFTLSGSRPDESRRLAEQAAGMLGESGERRVDRRPREPGRRSIFGRVSSRKCSAQRQKILQHERAAGMALASRVLSVCTATRGSSSVTRRARGDGGGHRDRGAVLGSAGELFGLRDAYARCICVAEDPAKALRSIRLWSAERGGTSGETPRPASWTTASTPHASLLLCGRSDQALAGPPSPVFPADHVQRRNNPVTEARVLPRLSVRRRQPRPRVSSEANARRSEFERLLPDCTQTLPFGLVAVAAGRIGTGGETARSATS